KWIPLDVAVVSGRPYLVEVQRTMFATDADVADAANRISVLTGELIAVHLRPVRIASGQPGRFHLFCRIADHDTRPRFADRARSLGLDVRRTIRPPLAPHRAGGMSYPLNPANWHEALAALDPLRPAHRPLSPAIFRLLRNGNG